jgi:hypothetical protein
MRKVLLVGMLAAIMLEPSPIPAHRGSKIAYFRVASKHVTRLSVQGVFHVSHRVNRHSHDGDQVTTETWCDIRVRAALVKRGRIVSRDVFTYFVAPHRERVHIGYYLARKGYSKSPSERAKRLAVRHVHVDLASCEAI